MNASQAAFSFSSALGANLFLLIVVLAAWLISKKNKTASLVVYFIGIVIQTISIVGQFKAIEFNRIGGSLDLYSVPMKMGYTLILSIIIAVGGISAIVITDNMAKNQTQPSKGEQRAKPEEKDVEKKKTITDTCDAISDAESIRQFKKLLDDGIITQEEFEAKKKQLLGL